MNIHITSYDYKNMCERDHLFVNYTIIEAMRLFSKMYPDCETLLIDLD